MQPNDQNPSEQTNTEIPTVDTPTAAPEPAVPAPVEPIGQKGKKKLWLIGGVVAAVLLLGASVGAYYGIFLPNNPKKITADALTNTVNPEKFQSSRFEGEVSFQGGEISEAISSVSFEGGIDTNSQATDLKITANTAVTKVNLDIRTTDGKSAYVRLSGLNGLDQLLAAAAGDSVQGAMVAQFAPLLAEINDKWFELDSSLLGQAGGNISTGEKLSGDDAKRLGEIYKKHNFINVSKRLGDESIHGTPSYHIEAKVNKEELKAFLSEVKSANIKAVQLEQKDIDELDRVNFDKYPFDIWVSKKSRFITQLATSFEEQDTTYKLRIAMKDINQPITVEKPAGARSVLELLGGLYSQQDASGGSNPLLSL